MTAFGVGAVTCSEAVFCLLADVDSPMGSGNGPSAPKMIVWGVEVDPVFCELSRERTLRQLAGRLQVRLFCFS